MANPYKQGMSAKRSQGNGTSQSDGGVNGHASNGVQRVRNQQIAQSPSRNRSVRQLKPRKSRSPELPQPAENFPTRGCSPSRRPSTVSCRMARTSTVSPSRLPPTMANPEGRGRKLPATPIRYFNLLQRIPLYVFFTSIYDNVPFLFYVMLWYLCI